MDLQLTTKAQEAFAQAATTATGKHHTAIEPAHLLLALAAQPGTTTPTLLEKAGSSASAVRSRGRSTTTRPKSCRSSSRKARKAASCGGSQASCCASCSSSARKMMSSGVEALWTKTMSVPSPPCRASRLRTIDMIGVIPEPAERKRCCSACWKLVLNSP